MGGVFSPDILSMTQGNTLFEAPAKANKQGADEPTCDLG